ncbi:hypothetical protein ACH4U3_01505 [Streptomyces griseoruber]|uniref:hypothetical protein n=1 Tax=Streptomyces griseoruber TaxID=1943 RepID=UPI0037B4C414
MAGRIRSRGERGEKATAPSHVAGVIHRRRVVGLGSADRAAKAIRHVEEHGARDGTGGIDPRAGPVEVGPRAGPVEVGRRAGPVEVAHRTHMNTASLTVRASMLEKGALP